MSANAEAPEQRLLRAREVERAVGLSRTTIWRLRRAGRFPQPVDVADVAVRWRSDEIAAWIESQPRANGAAAG